MKKKPTKKNEPIKRIDKVPKDVRQAVLRDLEATIKTHGIIETRLVITHYFNNYRQTMKRKAQVEELKKQISELNKK